jgi:amino acid adenylation domain-containing protein
MRISLIRLSEHKYRMLWTSHHILFDGWSLQILMEEFLRSYEELLSGKELIKKDDDRYEDYIRYTEREDKYKQQNYWRDYMKGVEQSTLLPFIGTTTQRTKGIGEYTSEHLELDPELTSKIERYAQKHRITVNTLMQGVWSYLLHRYTGSEDVVYGIIVSGRPDDLPSVESRVGIYINTLPLHSTLGKLKGKHKDKHKQKEESISKWLENLQSQQVSSRQYQYTPLQEIQKLTPVSGDLFDSLLVFENYPVSKVIKQKTWGLKIGNMQMQEQTNYPLTITILSADKTNISFSYNKLILDKEYVTEIRDHFENVLTQIITDEKNSTLSEIKLLTKAEEQKLLFEFNDTASEYPKDKTIVDLFEEQAAKTPDNVAVVFEDKQLTYRELNERSNQLAHYLQSKGVTTETLVPVCIERSIEMIIGILGILKAGGAYVPIDPEYPEERIKFMLEDTAGPVVVSSKENKNRLPLPKEFEIIEIDNDPSISKQSKNNLHTNVLPNHLAYVIYTSGSTGRPKGVMIAQSNVVSLVKGVDYVTLTDKDILLSTGSSSFDATTFEYWGMLLNGGQLILCTENTLLDSELLKKEIQYRRIIKMWFTSSWFNQLVDNDIAIFEGLKSILVGGEKLSEYHIEKLKRTYPEITIINGYGPTENTTFSLTYKITDIVLNVSIPIGCPLNNRTAYILNNEQQLLPVG